MASCHQRRGAVVAQVAISLTVLAGFAALAIDTGRMFDLRGEMQRSVDASALAGAGRLPSGSTVVHDACYNHHAYYYDTCIIYESSRALVGQQYS